MIPNKRKKRFKKILRCFSCLRRMQECGLLSIHHSSGYIYISSLLASVYLSDAKKWEGFLRTLSLWHSFRQSLEIYEDAFEKAECESVGELVSSKPDADDAERRLAKLNARMSLDKSVTKPDTNDRLTFYICDSINGGGSLLFAGMYEDGEMFIINKEECTAPNI